MESGSPQQSMETPITQPIGPRPVFTAHSTMRCTLRVGHTAEYRTTTRRHVIPLSFPFVFYGQSYNALYINNNGNVSSRDRTMSTPRRDSLRRYAMVAPFWADVDTRGERSGIVYYSDEPHRFTVVWDQVGTSRRTPTVATASFSS